MDEPVLTWAEASLDETTRTHALATISQVERARYDGTAAPHRDSFLAGRLLLRTLVAQLLGIAPEVVPLSARCPDCGGPHGAPVIERSDIFVSLARTPGFVVAAAHRGARIGVDVESLDQPPERLDAIAALTGERSIRRWTSVEAVLKADRRGLRVDPSEILFDGDRATVSGSAATYRLTEWDLLPGHTVTLATESR